MHDFDLFVVGGGSGGVRAARVAASHGARVAIAEEHRMGGTCVIRGCVPKKLMVYASRFRDTFDSASSFGWNVAATRFDWVRFSSAMHREVDRLEAAYRTNLQRAGVHIHDERAVIEDACTVRLTGSGQRLSARNILVATGARPAQLHGVPGGHLAITSNEIFGLAELPRRVLVVGGGYIAVEFAAVLAGLGCRVVLAYRADRLLRGFDDDIRAALEADYARRGIVLARACVVASIQQARDGLLVTLSDGNTLEVDQVLVAAGRRPNTDALGLEAAGVMLAEDGAIAVDAESRTVIDSIFAVGDVTNRICLTPVAIREAQAFADTQYGGQPTRFEHGQVATAVFSTPEIGVIGMTEQQARVAGLAVDVYRTLFRPMHAALGSSEERVLMKLVVDRASDRILGVHLLGEGSAELIQGIAISFGMGATKRDFDRTVAVHPTAAEELVTMRASALVR